MIQNLETGISKCLVSKEVYNYCPPEIESKKSVLRDAFRFPAISSSDAGIYHMR